MGDATINLDDRNALRHALMFELGAASDISLYIDQGAFDKAVEYSGRYQQIFRLLDDLGWNPDDRRPSYELTMDAGDLAAAVRFQLQQASEELDEYRDHTGPSESANDIIEEDELLCMICRSILDQLGEAVAS